MYSLSVIDCLANRKNISKIKKNKSKNTKLYTKACVHMHICVYVNPSVPEFKRETLTNQV